MHQLLKHIMYSLGGDIRLLYLFLANCENKQTSQKAALMEFHLLRRQTTPFLWSSMSSCINWVGYHVINMQITCPTQWMPTHCFQKCKSCGHHTLNPMRRSDQVDQMIRRQMIWFLLKQAGSELIQLISAGDWRKLAEDSRQRETKFHHPSPPDIYHLCQSTQACSIAGSACVCSWLYMMTCID